MEKLAPEARNDSRIWQDVYHLPHTVGTLYVKFTDNGLITEFTLLSFKEK